MFCTKCGTSLPKDARFCSKCGFPVPESLIQEQTELIQNESGHDDRPEGLNQDYSIEETTLPSEHLETVSNTPPMDEQSELKEFIGSNADYYLRKWGKSVKPERTVGWNWAAFFLSGYWLAYRKMYLPLLSWLLVVIVFNIVSFTISYDHLLLSTLLDLIMICINVSLGLFGNALYSYHANKKINQWHDDPTLQSKTTLAKMGGTGWLGVVLLIVANVVIGIIAVIFMAASIFTGLTHDGLTFGTGSNNNGVTGVQDHFSADTPIYLEATFGHPVGTDKLRVFLIKQNESNEEIIDKWSQEIDPNWDSIYFNLYNPKQDGYLDPGHYVVRIYDGADLLDDGEFDIISFSIDGGSNDIQF